MDYILEPGLDIVIHHKINDEVTAYYPFSKTSNIVDKDGRNIDELLATKADIDHAVPDVEPTNNLRYLRNDNSWATLPDATDTQKGIVNVASSLEDENNSAVVSLGIAKELDIKIGNLSGSISNFISSNEKGAPNGVATLDENGVISASQLPSYIDDIIQGYISEDNSKFFIDEGKENEVILESGKIYYDMETNKSYRYSGSILVEIPDSIALGTTSSTAFRGDLGQIAYDHSQSVHARPDATKVSNSQVNGNISINDVDIIVYRHPIKEGFGETNPHGTTKEDIGLDKVENLTGEESLDRYLNSDIIIEKLGYTPASTSLATRSTAGLMSPEDKTTLEELLPTVVGADNEKNNVLWLKTLEEI